MYIKHHHYLLMLSVIYIIWWMILAIDPVDRADWALENALVVLAVILLGVTWKRVPLSRISYTAIFLFLCIHEVGAHYTYSQTPYDRWFFNLFGFSLNEALGFERNHFDRFAHLSYGLLLAYPVREIFIRVARVRGFWGYFLPVSLTMSTSALFELFEWGAAELFGGDLGIAYLGTQGDVWDAQKDMAMATLGAIFTMIVTALINISLQRDFAKEWNESLQSTGEPLGEDEIIKMLRKRHSG